MTPLELVDLQFLSSASEGLSTFHSYFDSYSSCQLLSAQLVTLTDWLTACNAWLLLLLLLLLLLVMMMNDDGLDWMLFLFLHFSQRQTGATSYCLLDRILFITACIHSLHTPVV